jgi:hypothetical protein
MAFATWDSGQLLNTTLSGGNLTATSNSASPGGARAQGTNRTGKWYFEFTLGTWAGNNSYVGVATGAATVGAGVATNPGMVICSKGSLFWRVNNSNSSTVGFLSPVAGNVLCVALDLDNGLIWGRIGAGNWNNSASNNPATGVGGAAILTNGFGPAIDYYPIVGFSSSGDGVTANFGATAFAQTVPSGFTSGWTTAAQVDNLVVTRAGREVWIAEAGTVRATAVGREVWLNDAGILRATKIGREVWIDHAAGYSPVVTATRKRRPVWVNTE